MLRDAMGLPFEKLKRILPVVKGCGFGIQLLAIGFVGFALLPAGKAQANDFRLELPAKCELGVTCFFQNFVDLDPGPDIRDPWCGKAAYDGHKGTDIRLRSLSEIASDVPVIASASGVVKAVRDGEPDRLIATEADRAEVSGKECGNGLVVSHEDGFETQYCHLKNGSVSVRPGERVRVGDRLGSIGSSGLSQFPHVHLSLRRNGKWIDPVSGQGEGGVCNEVTKARSFFSESAFDKLPSDRRQLLGSGLSGGVIKHDRLTQRGAPPQATRLSDNTVGWVWLINLQKGDEISLRLSGPEGEISASTIEPLPRSKASYSAFTGRKRAPVAGSYSMEIQVTNKGTEVYSKTKNWMVE